MNAKKNSRTLGIVLVLTAAVLWGVSGTVAQYLTQETSFSTEWIVVVRLLVSGFLLLLLPFLKKDPNIWRIWQTKKDAVHLVIFGIFGMLAVQYTYFAAVGESNAATATLLQYLAPVLITLYTAVMTKALPNRQQSLAILLALAGTYLLVTGGNPSELTISGNALFLGIASAFALAFYTLNPIRLLKQYGSAVIVGWGMLVGGVGMSFVHPPWNVTGEASTSAIVAIIFIILFGTLIAFYCFLESLHHLNASEASLLACAEPLSAAFLAVIWLKVPFGLMEWAGASCILATIALLSVVRKEKKRVLKKAC